MLDDYRKFEKSTARKAWHILDRRDLNCFGADGARFFLPSAPLIVSVEAESDDL